MLAALCLTAAIPAHAQAPPGYPPSSVPPAPLLATEQLQELVGRVALYPDVINLMGDDLDWTEPLGRAVTTSQADLLEAIQVFRRKAEAAGNLNSDDKQLAVLSRAMSQIGPAKPEVIYVPVYQPATIVGSQPELVVTYVASAYPVYYNPLSTVAAADVQTEPLNDPIPS